MNWKGDPELQKLRESFLSSLYQRWLEMRAARLNFAGNPRNEQYFALLIQWTHQLAGSARSYQFPTLGLLSETLDIWLQTFEPNAALDQKTREQLTVAFELLDEAISQTCVLGDDPKAILADSRWVTLSEIVQALPVG